MCVCVCERERERTRQWPSRWGTPWVTMGSGVQTPVLSRGSRCWHRPPFLPSVHLLSVFPSALLLSPLSNTGGPCGLAALLTLCNNPNQTKPGENQSAYCCMVAAWCHACCRL